MRSLNLRRPLFLFLLFMIAVPLKPLEASHIPAEKMSVGKHCAALLLRGLYATENRNRWNKRIKNTVLEEIDDLQDSELDALHDIFQAMDHEQVQPDVNPFANAFKNFGAPQIYREKWLNQTARWSREAKLNRIDFGELASKIPEFATLQTAWRHLAQAGWKLRQLKWYLPPATFWTSALSLTPQAQRFDRHEIAFNIYAGLEEPWPLYAAGKLMEVELEAWTLRHSEFFQAKMKEFYNLVMEVHPGLELIHASIISEQDQSRIRGHLGDFLKAREILIQKLKLYKKLKEQFPEYASVPWERALNSRAPSNAFFSDQLRREGLPFSEGMIQTLIYEENPAWLSFQF